MYLRLLALSLLVTLDLVCFAEESVAPVPPAARKILHTTDLHGEKLLDNYFWLRDKKNPEVIKYIESENAYTATMMKGTEAFQEKLYKEILGRIKQTDLSVPYLKNGYWYYGKTQEGKQYGISCRKKGSLEAPEEILIDSNELAKGQKFFSLGGTDVSDDGSLLAYVTDTTGFREYFLSVKDLKTGKMIEERSIKVAQVEWSADNKTLFYVTEDNAKRSHKLWRHMIGQPKDKDVLIYEEKDELFRLGLSRSRDGKFLFSSSGSATTTEYRYLDASTPNGEFKTITPRVTDHEYSVEHRDGLFYIRTNKDKSTNFKVMTCLVENTAIANWKDFIAYNPAVMIERVSLFKNFAIISEREKGIPHLRIMDLQNNQQHRVEWPEPVYSASLMNNPEFDLASVQLSYSSMVTPSSVYDYNLKTKERKLLKQTEVPGGYDPAQYVSERIEATSPDGTKVPISLVYKKGLNRDGKAPLLLYGYGSYGATMPVAFSPSRLPLLDRGVVYALASIRGGSDLGRPWYDDGKMMKKKNTFIDFIACADHLVKEKYCSRDRLAIQGGSAGGLLVGASINMRPDMCKVALLQVPFVDVVNTMLDESLPLTIQEFLEWGNPKKKEEYDYIKTYCPYSNISNATYPSILVTTSLNDSQVLFHEPTKYVAKMRTMKTDKNPLLFKCNMDAGHGGASGRYDFLKETAFIYAFMLKEMGITQ